MGVPVVQERLSNLTGLSALNSLSQVLGPGRASRAKEWQVVARYGAGTSAGVLTVETASDASDVATGSWASVGTIPWTAASKAEKLQFTGVFHALRVRISTALVGGTLDYVDILGTN